VEFVIDGGMDGITPCDQAHPLGFALGDEGLRPHLLSGERPPVRIGICRARSWLAIGRRRFLYDLWGDRRGGSRP